ncbi:MULTISPECIES: SDR family oxidoreductase [Bordetella]|uniref:NAD(P)-dependent oxidoreductase n=1 Tax=Bordetella genomosp. 6 TaxID=463024 RepID=A0ABX4FGP9_9BORD|nr:MULTISPECIES: SDR family oxidoreductase [Bordetella]AOB28722.1 NAD(P)-dependent oxidoreductase [Bordetella bronchiseptica]ARP74942.1 NAD(P)-dependent oxidoreductase [Bordetella genomosp. 6]AZW46073.1 NAD(P)-dependent oxidoreductase [Bordetella bronchiseptica]KCV63733.1 oxidoreductase YgfF [Bordetella bronchiseptica 99-R-0433]MBN3266964.1 NAD(P)-dependent oxidoreductase [Bordetella bronchiseptica]
MIDHLSPNKVMIVTGAARGIGAAVALLAARRGYAVCVNYRSRGDAAEQVVQAIRDEGGRALAVPADVADEAQVVRLFETVDRELGRVDALVNNAGILEAQMRVEEMDAARITRILATNVVGAFVCCREAVRRMAPRHGGRGGAIVNVSSVAARLGSPGEYVDYAASKGALDTLTIGLSREVAADEIRVNAVRPGTIYTDMHASGGEPGRVDRLKDGIPLRRGGTVEEVAGAVMWFCSDEAGYTTGSFIEVSGGK